MNLSPYYPLHFWTVDIFARHRVDSALIAPDEQALKDLRAAGIRASTRFSAPLQIDYLQ